MTPEEKREYQRLWIARRRAKYLDREGPCSDCGSGRYLHFHHRDDSQKTSHRIWSWKEERIEKELAKCKVLCAKCHSKRHSYKLRKLSDSQVNAILGAIRSGHGDLRISKDFQIGRSTVYDIRKGKSYQELTR